MTMEDVVRRLREEVDLDPKTRSSWISAITTVFAARGLTPVEVLAHPPSVRAMIETTAWQATGIRQATWRNKLALIKAALRHVGVDVHRERGSYPKSAEWTRLLEPLPAQARKTLAVFAGWCTAAGIEPQDVDGTVFGKFWDFLQAQCIRRHLREAWLATRRSWNTFVAVADSSYPLIADIKPRRFQSLAWEAFPPSFLDDVLAWQSFASTVDLDEERKPLKAATITGYVGAFRQIATVLVGDGVSPAEITSLAVLLKVDMVRRAVANIRGSRSIEQARVQLRLAVFALLAAARWLERDPAPSLPDSVTDGIAYLGKAAGKLRDRQAGMAAKNRDRLARLQDPTIGRMFLNLTHTVLARHAGVTVPSHAQAIELQMAALHVLLLETALRMGNIAALDLERHITRPAGGQAGRWLIAIPAEEMKSGRPHETMLGEVGSAVLTDYVERVRPVLLKGPCSALFISRHGRPKTRVTLSNQYSAFIHREIGIKVNPHLHRHFAAMNWLNAMPGAYEAISDILGHASTAVTKAFYCGAERRTALQRWHEVLDARRAEAGAGRLPLRVKSRKRHGDDL
jgi:hypothetical protein